MNPSFAGGMCPQCGFGPSQSQFQQGWMRPYSGGFGNMPYGMMGYGPQPGFWGGPPVWTGTYAPGYQGFGGGQMGGFGPQAWGMPMGGFGGQGYGFGMGGPGQWAGSTMAPYAGMGLPTDDEIVDMIYDAIDSDPLIPWDADIDVTVDAGTVMLSGTVPNKRIKHAAGDDAWWIPGVTDVKNNLEVSGRRRAHAQRPEEAQAQQPATAGGQRRRSS